MFCAKLLKILLSLRPTTENSSSCAIIKLNNQTDANQMTCDLPEKPECSAFFHNFASFGSLDRAVFKMWSSSPKLRLSLASHCADPCEEYSDRSSKRFRMSAQRVKRSTKTASENQKWTCFCLWNSNIYVNKSDKKWVTRIYIKLCSIKHSYSLSNSWRKQFPTQLLVLHSLLAIMLEVMILYWYLFVTVTDIHLTAFIISRSKAMCYNS